jgi:metacaspase-1
MGLLGIVSSYARGDLAGMAGSAFGLIKKAVKGDEVYQRNLRTKTSPADVIMWSGSKDSQTSYVLPSAFWETSSVIAVHA